MIDGSGEGSETSSRPQAGQMDKVMELSADAWYESSSPHMAKKGATQLVGAKVTNSPPRPD